MRERDIASSTLSRIATTTTAINTTIRTTTAAAQPFPASLHPTQARRQPPDVPPVPNALCVHSGAVAAVESVMKYTTTIVTRAPNDQTTRFVGIVDGPRSDSIISSTTVVVLVATHACTLARTPQTSCLPRTSSIFSSTAIFECRNFDWRCLRFVCSARLRFWLDELGAHSHRVFRQEFQNLQDPLFGIVSSD